MFNLKSRFETKIKPTAPAAQPVKEKPNVRQYQDGNISVIEFNAIGLNYDALESLGEYNPQYRKAKKSKERKTIYEYHDFINKPVTFDGYKILINNVIIGYAPKPAYPVLDNGKITSVYAKIYGGNYVIVNSDGVWKENDTLHCSIRIRYK